MNASDPRTGSTGRPTDEEKEPLRRGPRRRWGDLVSEVPEPAVFDPWAVGLR